MRKIINKTIFLILSIILISACEYEDYQSDYEYSAVYFPKTRIDRSVIVGEYDYIQVGVVLGGKLSNDQEESVTYHLNTDTVLNSGLTLLPQAYYSIENSLQGRDANTFYIPAGKFQGMIKITLNDIFLNDSASLDGGYALGFELDQTSVDSVLSTKSITVITFKYLSTADAFYYHSGEVSSGDSTTAYIPKTWDLTTTGVGENILETDGLGNFTSGEYKCRLEINNDNSVKIESAEGGLPITSSGDSRYDPESRSFFLKYSYTDSINQFHSVDTLIFRNRIVDGINQADITQLP